MDYISLLRMLLSTLLAVYIGYTLQPVPRVLDRLFKESQLFKLFAVSGFILVNVLGMTLTTTNVLTSVGLGAVLLAGFEYARSF